MAETKHGAWICGITKTNIICSVCGVGRPFKRNGNIYAWFSNYCPECGAIMDLEASEAVLDNTNINADTDYTKTDCLLYDSEKGICRGLNGLYCKQDRQCAFYKNGTEKPRKKRW